MGVCAFPSTLLRLPAALYGAGPALRAVPVFGSSTKAQVVPVFYAFPGLSGSGSQRLGRTLPGCGAPFPSMAPARASQVPAACVCFQQLASSRDPPGGGCRPSRISGIL